ncbi:hypothetical protein VNO77_17410 [Canavalia gladiata]|uniref:Uncharacterized protein n=1 Tax=Canavalia gladiata TaxID=3824 RepID=A0AAN9QGL2_CANGL
MYARWGWNLLCGMLLETAIDPVKCGGHDVLQFVPFNTASSLIIEPIYYIWMWLAAYADFIVLYGLDFGPIQVRHHGFYLEQIGPTCC